MENVRSVVTQYNELIKSTRQASLYATKALDGLRFPSQLLATRIRQWQRDQADIFKHIASIASVPLVVQKQAAEITKFSNFTKQALDRLSWSNVGAVFQATPFVQDQLRNSFVRMNESYKRFWKALRIDPILIPNFSPIMIQQPSTDFYFATQLSYLITEQRPSVRKDEEVFLETSHQRNNSFLCELLPQLDPSLLILYQGAITSLDSNNPDKQRHVAVSLRELFTHILHTLSPENKFKEWNNDPNNLKDGRPTRKGRLLYIYRNINFPPFNQFIKRDVEAVLSFLDLLQTCTHKIKEPFSEQQSRAILSRMESIIYFIIKTNLK